MKKINLLKFGMTIIVILFTFSISSCTIHAGTHSHTAKKVPPGQAKKMNGDKSAKKYAPGQNK